MILEHAPRGWTSEQAEKAAQTIFADVKMLRQRRTREGCSFTFRGSHTTSHDLVALPLEDEDGQPSPVLWCRWAPPARTVQRQAIHTSGSWSLVRPKNPFQQTEVTTQPGAYAKKPDTTNGSFNPFSDILWEAGLARVYKEPGATQGNNGFSVCDVNTCNAENRSDLLAVPFLRPREGIPDP